MRSNYINANKWYTHAYAQFIHTLDGKMMFLHMMNAALQPSLWIIYGWYIVAKQTRNCEKEHASIIIIEFV